MKFLTWYTPLHVFRELRSKITELPALGDGHNSRHLFTMAGQSHDESRHYDTIILGAGMSGLACAERLFQHSSYRTSKKLLILEARDRIGGRIGCVHLNGYRLDTGANWIHGVGTPDDPNPLVQYVPDGHFRELNSSVTFRPRSPDTTSQSQTFTETQTDNNWVRVDPSHPTKVANKPKSDLVIPAKDASEMLASLWGLVFSLHEAAMKTAAEKAQQTTMLQTIMGSSKLCLNFWKAWRLPRCVHNQQNTPQINQAWAYSSTRWTTSMASRSFYEMVTSP